MTQGLAPRTVVLASLGALAVFAGGLGLGILVFGGGDDAPAVIIRATPTPAADAAPVVSVLTPSPQGTPEPTSGFSPTPVPTQNPVPDSTSPPTTSPAESTPCVRSTYAVQPGDTLSVVAKHFNLSAEALWGVNDIANPNVLHAGQVLVIPCPGEPLVYKPWPTATPVPTLPPTRAPTAAPTPVPTAIQTPLPIPSPAISGVVAAAAVKRALNDEGEAGKKQVCIELPPLLTRHCEWQQYYAPWCQALVWNEATREWTIQCEIGLLVDPDPIEVPLLGIVDALPEYHPSGTVLYQYHESGWIYVQ